MVPRLFEFLAMSISLVGFRIAFTACIATIDPKFAIGAVYGQTFRFDFCRAVNTGAKGSLADIHDGGKLGRNLLDTPV